jgi:hypothetical protein
MDTDANKLTAVFLIRVYPCPSVVKNNKNNYMGSAVMGINQAAESD